LDAKKKYQRKIDHLEEVAQGYFINEDLFFDNYEKFPLKVFSDRNLDRIKLYINNNYKITNQDGLFFQNSYVTLPLKEAVIDRTWQLRQKDLKKGIEWPPHEEAIQRNKNNFYSYEIHKSLRPYILGKLYSEGINEEYLFPDLNQMAEYCKSSYLSSYSGS
jgi:hypothetical protein